MKKLQFTIEINASKEKVWDALWNDQNYRNWTSVFHEGSHYKSDLHEGSEIFFLGPEKSGMYAKIEKLVPNEKMYFLHLGEYKDGEKQEGTFGEEAIEQYDLVEKDGKTELTVTMNVPEDYIPYFAETFPKALGKVKEMVEK
jgi:uncharacterized protein YndB with AHSA1/START domain